MKKLLLLIAVCAFCSAGNAILSQENCGGSVWQTSLTENYPNNANDTLTSGIFDFSLLTADPSIYFDLSYITETNYDEVWLEFSLDGGAAWTKLIDDGSAVGWYNDLTNQWWEGGDAAWNTVSNTIPESAGVSSVQVRFIFSSDGSSNRDGIAIDNVLITSDYSDIMLLGVNNIISGISNYSDSEPLEFELVNVGSSSITNVEICYNINGGADICETITDEILPGTFLYSFDSTEDFSTSGDYLINASVSNASDSRPCY